MMMSDDDDDSEPQLNVVADYYLLDADKQPICLSVLPIRFEDTDEARECKRSVFLWGTADPGIKVYKQVVAWKLGLEGRRPEIAMLSTEGSWINLAKPKNSYEECIRTILITVQMLHFLRRKPEEPEKNLWIHLRKVFEYYTHALSIHSSSDDKTLLFTEHLPFFSKFDVRPSEDDFRNHRSLMKQFAEKDVTLAKSQILQAFIEERSSKKISEVGSDNFEIKKSFIAADEDIEDMVADCNIESDEEEDDLFDSTCAICDDGGDLLGCDGPCMRSFHAKIGTGQDSYCDTLGYTEAEVEAMKTFLCKNCEYKQHQCFICGVLEPSDGPTAKVFLCNNATCGYFYHPKCVAQRLHPNNKKEALEMEKNITAGSSFTCPIHWCFDCKGLEDRTHEHLQFAVCRRCPKSYHRKCLPREIPFEDSGEGIIRRAWDLSKRILIYCLDHEIDTEIDTPVRNHIKFPRIPKVVKPADYLKKKTKNKKKKRTFGESFLDQPSNKPVKLPDKVRVQENEHARKIDVKSSSKQHVDKPEKKRAKFLKQSTQTEPNMVNDASISSPEPATEQEKQLATLRTSTMRKMPQSSFPIVDSETEKRVIALVEKKLPSLTLKDVSRKCLVPSTHVYPGRQIDRIIATGKLERSVQAVGAALKMLETGGNVNDAQAVCEPQVLRQLARWHSKLGVYISPFIHGSRYSSFGRHFTKVEKLVEIVDKLHWYVEPGDMIVDFCCGANDFSRLMKEKLDQVQKKCHFKNYDLIQPQNSFCFERRDWMTVQPKELPCGSQLIMGLNPPFGVKAALANKFIDKALTFKPKLIILIVPKETKRLDRKKTPYDLVWEDSDCLAGKAFYLPGSVDVNDKIVEGWNASVPPLYLWSHPDWTMKHKKVAEQHNHTSIGKTACRIEEGGLSDDVPVKQEAESSGLHNSALGKEEENTGKTSCHLKEANLSDDIPARRQAEPKSKQNTRSGKGKETREKTVYDVREVLSSGNAKEAREKTACNVREDSPSDDRLVKKQARSGEEKAQEANPSGSHPAKKQAEATFQHISRSRKQNSRDGSKIFDDRSRKRTPDKVGSLPPEKQVEVAYEERRIIPSKRSIHQEQRDACCEDGTNTHREEPERVGDSDMIMSSPDTSNARNRPRSYCPLIPTEQPSDRTAHPDSNMNYPAKGSHVSTFKSGTYQGSYLAHRDGYNDALEQKNDPAFYTNADDRSRNYSSNIDELTKQYAAAPGGYAYSLQSQGDDGNFYRRQDDYPQINRYSLGCSSASYAQPSLTSPSYGLLGTTASRSSVMDKYAAGFLGPSGPGGSVMDNYAPRVLAPSAPGSSVMDNYAPRVLAPSAPGSSVMDNYAPRVFAPSAPGSSVMDKYAPPLEETNYTTRGVRDVPGYGRDVSGDPMSLVPPQYPYRLPGSSGRGPPYI